MSTTDTQIRELFLRSCTHAGLDTSTLTVHVHDNILTLRGIVASEEQRHKLWALLETVDSRVTDITSQVRVRPIVQPGQADVSVTSISSRPQSQPQTGL